MTTLQKFKLLATQCAVVAGSPTRSPSPAPSFHLRRRRTLRHLLARTASRRRGSSDPGLPPPPPAPPSPEKKAPAPASFDSLGGRTLKDLFISSPPPRPATKSDGSGVLRFLPPPPAPSQGRSGRGGGGGGGVGAFRYRVIRRVWRPVLMSISESGE